MSDSLYLIQIQGFDKGEVRLTFSFNPVYHDTSKAELEEIIGIAKELQRALQKIDEAKFKAQLRQNNGGD